MFISIHGVRRLLFSRVGKPSAGGAIACSFNDPRGACPECGGLGKKVGVVSDDWTRLDPLAWRVDGLRVASAFDGTTVESSSRGPRRLLGGC